LKGDDPPGDQVRQVEPGDGPYFRRVEYPRKKKFYLRKGETCERMPRELQPPEKGERLKTFGFPPVARWGGRLETPKGGTRGGDEKPKSTNSVSSARRRVGMLRDRYPEEVGAGKNICAVHQEQQEAKDRSFV